MALVCIWLQFNVTEFIIIIIRKIHLLWIYIFSVNGKALIAIHLTTSSITSISQKYLWILSRWIYSYLGLASLTFSTTLFKFGKCLVLFCFVVHRPTYALNSLTISFLFLCFEKQVIGPKPSRPQHTNVPPVVVIASKLRVVIMLSCTFHSHFL